MSNILVLGAGRSSSALIEYLLEQSAGLNCTVTVADQNPESARQKTGNHPAARPVGIALEDAAAVEQLINEASVVISLLPPTLHYKVALSCLKYGRHLLTASYVNEEIRSLDLQAKEKGILILMENGLDPGIDHLSAMKEIDSMKEKGGVLKSFRSYTGGLVAPESDNNPWHYKFTWNPKNVILAGQGNVKYLENNKFKYIPYQQLFARAEEIEIEGEGIFEGYANRDSLSYLKLYNLNDVSTFIRGTLRKSPYCRGWNSLVQLGMTADSFEVDNPGNLTWSQFADSFLPEIPGKNIEEKFCLALGLAQDAEEFKMIRWTGLFSDEVCPVKKGTPADYLLSLFEKKFVFAQGDKDMIVMQHQMQFEIKKQSENINATLVVKGDEKHSAMAKTVGLPLGITAKLILQNKIKLTGVQIPVMKELYEPLLKELEEKGIRFKN
jgi:saccharopine dehydrogenase-like NADP-dependent oxidoreductase